MGGGNHADLVLRGGHAYLVDAARSWAQAVAVTGGRIAAVGTDAEVSALTGPHTEVIDLAGRMLLPGFTDSHVHASGGGLERIRCDLAELHGRDDYLAAVRAYADSHPAVAWVTGGGWSMDVFPGGVPSKEDLDRAVPDRPVFLSNRDHHAAWVNSRALALAGIDAATPDPADGRIERDARGEPSGALQEGAMNLVERAVPRPGLDEQVAGICEGQRYLHALGITAWQEAIVGDYAVVPDCFDAYLEAERRGLLTARVVGALWWQRGTGTGQLDGLVERRARAGHGRFRATSVKIMQDGICENFTASMLAPYLDGHGHATAGAGASFFDPQELKAAVTAIDAQGFQVHFHAIGDRAVRETLDAVEAARTANGPGGGRHHISHLQVVHPDDLPRFRALSVVANCQPLWACHEPQMTELTLPFLGGERGGWQYPFGSLARSGAQLSFGSDWPVSSPNPLWEIHTAVNRTVPPGYPYGGAGGDEPFLPAERIDLATALAAATIGSAYVNHAELETGSIEVGKQADLVVLDRDLFAHPAGEIALAQVDLTISGGAVVHAR
ncbi:MAG TPA: amidohydrolase [Streptosporangiaceae bacterium]|nr:amidohydrolase [Streptosporangiaceae bacterium]